MMTRGLSYNGRPQREERAEWQIVLPRNLAARDQQQAHAGTDYAAQQDRHEHWPPAEKCANHGKQLNVSSAHAFLPKDQGADPRNEVEQPPANEKSGDAVPPLGQHECSRREPNRHAGYRDTVWHDHVIEINKAYDEKGRPQGRIHERHR